MILTPTYHVFDLFKGHQDAVLLDSYVEARDIDTGEHVMPDLHVSASQSSDGALRATLVNLSLDTEQDIRCMLSDSNRDAGSNRKSKRAGRTVSARVLTGKMDAYNDFNNADRVKPQVFDEVKINGDEFVFQIPPCAVMEIVVNE